MQPPFDGNDPWHAQVDFIFQFYCETKSCEAELHFGDLPASQLQSLDHAQLCVALSELAQARGWTCLKPFEFLCPRCSAARLTQSEL